MEPTRDPRADPIIIPGRTLAGLVSDRVLDAELAALAWLLVEGGVPLVVAGADPVPRAAVGRAILAVDASRPWVLLEVGTRQPSIEALAALLRGGSRVGLEVAGGHLRDVLRRLTGPPVGLPEDAVRRLGIVLVTAAEAPGPRVIAAHYLRPTERDAGGHVQRRPPAVLATWDARRDAFEHYAWGVMPELGDRVGRTQADLEERQLDRAALLERAAASGPLEGPAFATLVRGHLAAEPPRVPPIPRPAARPSRLAGGLTDPRPHPH